MRKLTYLLILLSILVACKGRNSGPLVKESYDQPGEEAPVMQGQKSTGPARPEKISETVEPCNGCIRLSELFSDKKAYNGREISVTGRVVKFNAEIMGKNWIHLQDGTESDGEYDLTITTSAVVNPGDVVTFSGKISLDKDFGYGYKYDIIMEDANLAGGNPHATGSF